MTFKLCCDNPKIVEYSLNHEYLMNNEKRALIDLILYLPEMKSYQSSQNTIFSNNTYDDYLYSLFVKKMKLGVDDIKYVEGASIIDKTEGDYFKDKICESCQKIIFQKRRGVNKVLEIFRHVRNSLAHGCFNIVDDVFIGFDRLGVNNPDYTAVIKAKYSNFIDTLNALKDINSLEQLYTEVLKTLNYQVVDEKVGSSFADLFVKKDGISYCLQFKQFGGRYINIRDLQNVVENLRYIDKTNFIFVLVVDSTYTNSKINAYIANEHIAILDKKFIKEMLEGRDVLQELLQVQI